MPEADARPIGVVVMAYGTPAGPAEVEPYYTHVRRGRPPTPEQLADLLRRYEAIGGVSPLLERTRGQVAGVAEALGPGWVVEVGMKHARPFVEDAVSVLVARGVDRLVGVVLAPHYSELSVGEYKARLATAAAAAGVAATAADSWHLAPALLDLLAAAVTEAVASLGSSAGETGVVFTAHSLPTRILDTGDDPYPEQLRQTAAAVADLAGLTRWRVAWQSAGRTPEPWIGPDILDVLRELATEGEGRSVVVCPAGFTSDHLEVLYDIDVEAQAVARHLGLRLARTALPNDHPALCRSVADAVRSAAAEAGFR